MYNLNVVTVFGRLTRNPEQRITKSGKSLVNFSIAVQDDYKKDLTHFFDCFSFLSADYIFNNFKKGNRIAVIGVLNQERWEDSSGSKRSKVNIKVKDVQKIDFENDRSKSNMDENPFSDDDIPC